MLAAYHVPLDLGSGSYDNECKELLIRVINNIDKLMLCEDRVEYGRRLYDLAGQSVPCSKVLLRVCGALGTVNSTFATLFLSSYGKVPLHLSRAWLVGGIQVS